MKVSIDSSTVTLSEFRSGDSVEIGVRSDNSAAAAATQNVKKAGPATGRYTGAAELADSQLSLLDAFSGD